MNTPGKIIKEKRLDKKVHLRDFCLNNKVDPNVWSKVERDLLSEKPEDTEIRKICESLEMNQEETLDLFYAFIKFDYKNKEERKFVAPPFLKGEKRNLERVYEKLVETERKHKGNIFNSTK